MRANRFLSRLLAGVCAATLLLVPQVLAQTATLDAAKADCVVGERIDGYIGFVEEARVSEGLRREVRDINQRRATFYDQLAARNGVTPRDAAKLTAEKLINDAPSGHCVQNEGGQWVRVP